MTLWRLRMTLWRLRMTLWRLRMTLAGAVVFEDTT